MQATGGRRKGAGMVDVSRPVQPQYGDQSALPREGRSDQRTVRPPIAAGGGQNAKADQDQPKASPHRDAALGTIHACEAAEHSTTAPRLVIVPVAMSA